MMSYFKDKEKRRGLIGTIVFHLALLLIFIFFGLTYVHPPEELGVMVDFGYTDQGMGEIENKEATTEDVQEEVVPSEPTPTEPVVAEEEVATQEVEETVVVPPKKEEKKVEQKKTEPVPEKKPSPSDALTKAMEKNSNTKAAEAGSEGNKPGVGNMGQTYGDPDGERNGGGGDGGISFSLAGRRMVEKPKIENNSQEFGNIVVSITVDKYGNVTKATGGAKGSSTTSAHLTKLAEEAAKKIKFSANPDAKEEQFGSITIRFTPK